MVKLGVIFSFSLQSPGSIFEFATNINVSKNHYMAEQWAS
jgi:hypothetical protein